MENDKKIAFRLLLDSALLVGATTGSRMILVASLIALGPFISASEMAAYDLFVIVSAYLMILLTLGMDSGLAIVANARTEHRQTAFAWLTLFVLGTMTLLAFLPAWLVSRFWLDTVILDNQLFLLAFTHAAISGAIVLVFAFFRWMGNATIAACIVITGSILGVAAAFGLFFLQDTIASFISGLILGNGAALVACLGYLIRHRGFSAGLLKPLRAISLFHRIMQMSLPFMLTSFLLLSRRAVDRGLLLAIGGAATLGPFAYVARLGEILAFLIAIPASGMAPAFVRNHAAERYRRLARLSYIGYLILAVAVTAASLIFQINWSNQILPFDARPAGFVITAMVAGNLFFGEIFIAGFGYVIKEKGRAIALTTAFFIAVYLLLAGTAAYLGYGLSGIACGFVIAAWLYATVYVHFAERLVSFDYPMLAVHLLRLATLAIALLSLTRLGMPV